VAGGLGRRALVRGAVRAGHADHCVRGDALCYLAAHQGKQVEPETEEEPGKIMHELRDGEMAHAREIPHRPYYGSVDATPLFLVLLGEYVLWTGDVAFAESLWPAAEAALHWMEKFGDPDGDLFLEYRRVAEKGLTNQGWKDSRDGVCFPDGTPLEAPIALVEVQGYASDAYRRMALLARKLGKGERAHALAARARALSRRIEEHFYSAPTRFYALALDHQKRAARTVTSNPGHLLFSRAIPAHRAREVLQTLFEPPMWSGWGIRTLAKGQKAYNPLSYHNGTIWPHDNALIAWGAALYGDTARAAQVFEGLLAAAQHFRHHRMPELFCGLSRDGDFPVHYPVACSPQAWSSAAQFLLLRAVLGLHPDAARGVLHVRNPRLPDGVEELSIEGMRLGRSRVDLHFTRRGEGTFVAVTRTEGPPLAVRVDLGPASDGAAEGPMEPAP
jgi:glycogen debranching enzyme